MANWAEINKTGKVLRVIVVADDKDAAWIKSRFGGTWVQTSYTGSIRKNYASIGYTYDKTRDAFIPPTPFTSWVLNEDTCQWEAPIEYPTDGKDYSWDKDTVSWVEVPTPEEA